MTRQYLTAAEMRVRAKVLGLKLRAETAMDDDLLNEYLQLATEEVEDYTERIFASAYYDETFRGDDSTTYLVQQYPLLQIVSLSQTTIDASPETTNADVSLLVRNDINDSCGRIELSGGDEITTFAATDLYTVRYRAGFDTLPLRVKQATALYCVELMKPDFADVEDGKLDMLPMSSEQIVELLGKLRRRRLF